MLAALLSVQSWHADEDVARLVAELPEVTHRRARRERTWAVAGRTFAWEPLLQQSRHQAVRGRDPTGRPDTSAVRVADLAEKKAVIAETQPTKLRPITTINGYAGLLIQLEAVKSESLRNLVVDAWLAALHGRWPSSTGPIRS